MNRITQEQVGGMNVAIFKNENSCSETFLNDESLELNKIKFLRDMDKISLVDSSFKMYAFHDYLDNEQKLYPEELRRRYIISYQLGRGSFGEVNLAYNKNFSQLRAIKILEKEKSNMAKYHRSEVEVLRSVEHPFIVRMFEMAETEDRIYLVMEFIDGGEMPSERLHEKVRFSCFFYIVNFT